jgi:hypothetical protein
MPPLPPAPPAPPVAWFPETVQRLKLIVQFARMVW